MYHWLMYLSVSSKQGPNTYMKLKAYYYQEHQTKFLNL